MTTNQNTAYFILATAGHVDHGKSSLVRALTGTDPDRLPEEKARGITIELGFAYLELEASLSTQARIALGIIDVPGHEDFVKNMAAGVGAADLGMLVIAADDGWMPQTEEHLQILIYLGVPRILVALTKIDLVPERIEPIMSDIRDRLQGTPFVDCPIVPTSTVTGAGLVQLRETFRSILDQAPEPRDIGKPRLPIDRAFVLHGIGTVVTGTQIGGDFQRSQNVILQPSGCAGRIRTIQSYNRDVESSIAGSRTAISLSEVPVAPRSGSADASSGARRGQTVTLPQYSECTQVIDVWIERLSRGNKSTGVSARPLKSGSRVRIHQSTWYIPARLLLLDKEVLELGESGLARLQMETSAFVFLSDRFIVRDWAEQNTLAGGVVLDPFAGQNRRNSPRQNGLLKARASNPYSPETAAASQIERDQLVKRGTLLSYSSFSETEIEAAVAKLLGEEKIRSVGPYLVDGRWWKTMLYQCGELIGTYHREHPDHRGMPISALRAKLEPQFPHADDCAHLLQELPQIGFRIEGTQIWRQGHVASLPSHLQSAGMKVMASLKARPLDPPSRKEIAPDAATQQALRYLIQNGSVVEAGPDVILLRETFESFLRSAKEFLQAKGNKTVSEIRQALGTTRRIVVPFLEKLDREGITIRQGDVRSLRKR